MYQKNLKRFLFKAALPWIGMLILGACRSAPEGTAGRFAGEALSIAEVIPGRPDAGDESPRMTITLNLYRLPGEAALDHLVRDRFYDGEDAAAYGGRLIAAQRAAYREACIEAEELAKDGLGEAFSAALNWDYTEAVTGNLVSPGVSRFPELLVLCRSREYYLGGAHGMREKQYLVIDPRAEKTFTLDDVLKDGSRPALGRLVEAALRARAGLAPTLPLTQGGYFEDSPEIPENFFLSAQGLGFHWDPYEIAPYAMGPIEITIPYGDMKDLVRR
jgi:hypothetical protein